MYFDLNSDEQVGNENSIENAGIMDSMLPVFIEKRPVQETDRPELQRMINDLQPDEVSCCRTAIDRYQIVLPLDSALALINSAKERGAKLAIPGIVDLTELANAFNPGAAEVAL